MMKHCILAVFIFLSTTCSVAMSADGVSNKSLQLQLIQYDDKIRQVKDQNNEIKNDLINKTIGFYQITNDRLNTHISFISLIATIFGLIIAIGGAWIGYESIRSRRRTEEAINTLEEAKKYVEGKKEEFNERISSRLEDIDLEFQKIVGALKEQLVFDISKATNEVKNLAEIKTQEIHGYTIESKSEEVLESINRRIAFFENIGIPDDPSILLSKAKLLDEKEMFDEAIELLEKLVKLDPKNVKGYWQLGWEFSKKGNPEKSVENYKTCIELEPNNATAYNNMGVELERLEQYEESLAAYEVVLSKGNGKELYHSNKAKILQKLGRLDDSIETYKNAITLFPTEERLYKGLLDTFKKLERFEDMIEYYDLAITNIAEKSQFYNFDKAIILRQLNKAEEAIKILTNLADQNYKTTDCHIQIADIWSKQGRYENAIMVLDKAISMDSKNSELHLKKVALSIDNSIEHGYEAAINGFDHIKEEPYLLSCARLFAVKRDVVNARNLYLMAGEISKSKFSEHGKEGDFMNYYESLVITKRFDEANKLIDEYRDVIKSNKYVNVLKVLNLYETISRNITINIKEEAKNYSIISNNDKINWNFEDILNLLHIEAPENYKFVLAIANFLNKKINQEEFNAAVEELSAQ